MKGKKQTDNNKNSKKDNKKMYLTKVDYSDYKTFDSCAKAIAESLKTYVKQSPSGLGGSIVANVTHRLKTALEIRSKLVEEGAKSV